MSNHPDLSCEAGRTDCTSGGVSVIVVNRGVGEECVMIDGVIYKSDYKGPILTREEAIERGIKSL